MKKVGNYDYSVKSYHDYPTRGEFIDFAYLTHRSLALTIEVNRDKRPVDPSKIKFILSNQIRATLQFIGVLVHLDKGTPPNQLLVSDGSHQKRITEGENGWSVAMADLKDPQASFQHDVLNFWNFFTEDRNNTIKKRDLTRRTPRATAKHSDG